MSWGQRVTTHGAESSVASTKKILKEASLSITKLSQQHLWKEALQVIAGLPADLRADIPIFNAALTACGRALQRQKVCDMLWTIKKCSLQLSIVTYGSAISALMGDEWEVERPKKPWQIALDLFGEIRFGGFEPNIFVCSQSVSATADWRASMTLFHDMRKLSVSPNLVTFGALISACERQREWLHALEFVDYLASRNLENNLHTLCTAMSACEKGSWQTSLSLLRYLRGPFSFLKANAFACSAVVRACAKASGGWARALHLFFELERSNVEVNAVALSTALAACEVAGRWEIALQLIAERAEILDLACLNCAINCCERGSQWKHALAVFDKAELPNDSTYCAAMVACRKANQWQRALSVWTARQGAAFLSHPTAITWTAAVSAAESGCQWQLAVFLLQRCREASVELDGILYSAASSACQKSRQWSWPLHILQVMQCGNMVPPLVAGSIALDAAADWKLTLYLLDEMQGPAQSDSEIMALVVAACQEQQRHEQLGRLLEDSQEATVEAIRLWCSQQSLESHFSEEQAL